MTQKKKTWLIALAILIVAAGAIAFWKWPRAFAPLVGVEAQPRIIMITYEGEHREVDDPEAMARVWDALQTTKVQHQKRLPRNFVTGRAGSVRSLLFYIEEGDSPGLFHMKYELDGTVETETDVYRIIGSHELIDALEALKDYEDTTNHPFELVEDPQ